MSYQKFGFDSAEICKRASKYIIVAIAVAFATNNIPESQLSLQEIIMISIIAACSFAIVDMYAPSVYYNKA